MKPLLLALVLTWNLNQDPDLAGYRLYRGGESEHYTNVTQVASPPTTVRLVPGTYFFAVTAVSGLGLESQFSNEFEWVERGAQDPPVVFLSTFTNLTVTLGWWGQVGSRYRVLQSEDLAQWYSGPWEQQATNEIVWCSFPCPLATAFFKIARL